MTIYALKDTAPQLAEDVWIAPSAELIGKIVLEEKTSIWFGAILRGDNEEIVVGAGSNLQEQVMCHTDPGYPLRIGANCTIGHKAMLHGCTIGENSLVGMGATVLNGAQIGKNCLIGAGALVPEGRIIPDGSLVVGVPGKVIRELDTAAIDGLKASALSYQRNAARFREELRQLG